MAVKRMLREKGGEIRARDVTFVWKSDMMRHSEGRVSLKGKYLHMHTHVNTHILSHAHVKPKTWQEIQPE